MSSIQKLTEYFSRFPGIGVRQAERFVYFLLNSRGTFNDDLATAIVSLKSSVQQCENCFSYFEGNNTNCIFCTDSSVEKKTLLVVEKDPDLNVIRKSDTYNGAYFVLGGLMPLAGKKYSAGTIRAEELKRRIQIECSGSGEGLQEIIFALSANPQGDATLLYLVQFLEPLLKKYSLKITTLGRGLSTGTELEYSDAVTIKHALENRK